MMLSLTNHMVSQYLLEKMKRKTSSLSKADPRIWFKLLCSLGRF